MLSAKHYLQLPYARILIPVDGGFHTEILEFPGCYAQGKTPGIAYKNLERAAESWIEACLDKGQQVPEPSGSVDYSGIVSLRLPKSVHRQAAKFAERDRTSLNTFLLSAVSAKVGAEEFIHRCGLKFPLARPLHPIQLVGTHGHHASECRIYRVGRSEIHVRTLDTKN